ncbi:MAG TPA: hypothetical protein VGH19_06585 [Verrucomicrobiae bacterium]
MNHVLGAPEGMHNCSPLAVYTNFRACISVWELTDEEVEKIVRGRRIALGVYSGVSQPAVHLQALDAAESPWLPPLEEISVEPDSQVQMSQEDLNSLPPSMTVQCKHCRSIRAFHLRPTMQCPIYGKGTLTGFGPRAFEAAEVEL